MAFYHFARYFILWLCWSMHCLANTPSCSLLQKTLYTSDGSSYVVEEVTSSAQLEAISNTVGLDYRIHREDTSESLSCLHPIALDEHYTRSKVWGLKKDGAVVGVATLLVEPSQHFANTLYLKKEVETLLVQPCSTLFTTPLNSLPLFLIEIGSLKILPSHRHVGLASALISKIVIPTIQELLQHASSSVVVVCAANGAVLRPELLIIQRAFRTYETMRLIQPVTITPEMRPYLGQASPEAIFTPHMAKKMGLQEQEGVFSMTLGPVFWKVIERR